MTDLCFTQFTQGQQEKCGDNLSLYKINQSLRRGLALRPRPSRALFFLGPDGGGRTKA
jgi:hypothetical protein